MPPDNYIVTGYNNNPDGFGLVYWEAGMNSVHISKGFMGIKDVFTKLDSIGNPTAKTIVMHFRLATHGKVCPENCHPFPITSDNRALQATEVDTKYAVAHNGIIPGMVNRFEKCPDGVWRRVETEMSDTQYFITNYLALCGKAVFNQGVAKLIAMATSSRFVVLGVGGKLQLIGDFEKEGGIYYSNYTYKWSYQPITDYKDEVSLPPTTHNKSKVDYPLLKYSKRLGAWVNPDYYPTETFEEDEESKRYGECSGCRKFAMLVYDVEWDSWLCPDCLAYYEAVGNV